MRLKKHNKKICIRIEETLLDKLLAIARTNSENLSETIRREPLTWGDPVE
jgi:hypothetical protein